MALRPDDLRPRSGVWTDGKSESHIEPTENRLPVLQQVAEGLLSIALDLVRAQCFLQDLAVAM